MSRRLPKEFSAHEVTPNPERVTLTAYEHFDVYNGGNGVVERHLGKCLLVEDAGRFLAAREQALREEIAEEIEAHGARWDHSADWRGGVDEAADIARGSVR